MQKIKKKIKVIAFTLCTMALYGVSSCDTNDDEFIPSLPEITLTGENTFGCFAKGILVTPRSGEEGDLGPAPGMRFFSGPALGDSIEYYDLKIEDYKSSSRPILFFHIPKDEKLFEGTQDIKDSNCKSPINSFPNSTVNITIQLWSEEKQINETYCSIENSGILEVLRYDEQNKIIAAKFNCLAFNNENDDDIIEITDGRFDINWGTLNDYTPFP